MDQNELLAAGVAMMERYNEAARREARRRMALPVNTHGRTFGRKGLQCRSAR